MAKTTPTTKQNKLVSWFFNAPAKFALLSFGLMAGITLVYSFIISAIKGVGTPINPWPIAVLMLATIIFSIYKLIKWLPSDNLDRRSFVATSNGLTFIYLAAILSSTIFMLGRTEQIILYTMWLQYYSALWFFFVVTVASVIYLYVFGVLIANIYTIYRRAITMGVPKWKAILSLPFSIYAFLLPGYLLTEDKKTKSTITIKSKWYAKVTDWVIAKPINAILIFALILIGSACFMDIYTLALMALFIIVFVTWVWVVGAPTFRKTIGGMFSTIIATLNIALVVFLIGMLIFPPKISDQITSDTYVEQIEITETVEQ